MFRVVNFAVLFATVQLVLSYSALEDDKLKHINLDIMLNNKRILIYMVNCLVDKGPCTAQGKELKHAVQEVIKTSCRNCSPKQKERVRHIVNILQTKHKDQWDIIYNKHDPKRNRVEELQAFLAEN